MSNYMPHDYAAKLFAEDKQYRDRCHDSAADWARANKSDPNAYSKCLNDFRHGIAYAGRPKDPLWVGAEGYSIQWQQETRSYENGNQTVEYSVSVPTNMKVPSA